MKVLVTGATGLIGNYVTDIFRSQGHEIHYLTTRTSAIQDQDDFKGFLWDLNTMAIDPNCIKGVDTIIHLAGESVFQRWTAKIKKRIVDSRVKSTQLLVSLLQENDHKVQHVITASAIGIYPNHPDPCAYKEHDIPPVGEGFLADVCVAWEQASQAFKELGVIHSIVRIGIVLAAQGGALEKMARPVRMYVGSGIASGRMWQSWIAAHDLAGIFYYIAQHKLAGVFNAVAPQPVTNKQLVKSIGAQLRKPVFLPNIPSFIIRLLLGEMSSIVLSSQHVCCNTIELTGYSFKFPTLDTALQEYL